MIKAIIFDMDGLLINSEPFWEEAEIEIFNKIGVPVTLKGTLNTMGLRIDEVVEYWYTKYPWTGPSKTQIEKEIVNKVIELVNRKGEALPGVFEILKYFWDQKIPMAIASSSQMIIINAVVKKLK
ncbi:MAG: HAD hydrolase-like protein [Candidatus Daviesbacteria bacterium]|nr:HAD hydrolase-like protein [Candidatus Daviesbacteria bacterium]